MVTIEHLQFLRYLTTMDLLVAMGLDEFQAEPVAFFLCLKAPGVA